MNPFAKQSIPELLALVKGQARCRECQEDWTKPRKPVDCPACNNTGKHPPLENAELDALSEQWCNGNKIYWDDEQEIFVTALEPHRIPKYTTDPREAMRLQVKYEIRPKQIVAHGKKYWVAQPGLRFDQRGAAEGNTIEALCHAITKAALIAQLTMREELV